MMIKCPACSEELPDHAKFCGACGYKQGDTSRKKTEVGGDKLKLGLASTQRILIKKPTEDKPRRLRRFILRVAVILDQSGSLTSGFAVNISSGGLFIDTDADCEVGETIRVQLRLPTMDHSMALDAQVMWRREEPKDGLPMGIGVSFIDPPEVALNGVALFISEHDPKYFED